MRKFFQLLSAGRVAELYIYGDITSWPWDESDVSAAPLVKEIDGLDVDIINVYINSYGGEIAEGLAIMSALARNKAKVITHCDGFACSCAANIFMAGDERMMSEGSALFVHEGLTFAWGHGDDLRKAGDEIDAITEAAVSVYFGKISISEEKFRAMLKSETWIFPEEAVEMGFATGITQYQVQEAPSQCIRQKIMQMLLPTPIKNGGAPTPQLTVEHVESIIRQAIQHIAAPADPQPMEGNIDLKQFFMNLLI